MDSWCRKNSAAQRGRSNEFFSKIPERISFYPQNFLMTFSSHRKLQQNNYAAAMASARRTTEVGDSGAHKLSAAARPAHHSSSREGGRGSNKVWQFVTEGEVM